MGTAIVAMPASEQESEMWHGVAPAAASAELLMRLRDALRSRHKVRITYRKGAGDDARERTVRSYGLIAAWTILVVYVLMMVSRERKLKRAIADLKAMLEEKPQR